MPERQRIFVVSTTTAEADVLDLKTTLGRDPLVLTAPTGEAKRVVNQLGTEPVVEILLAPVAYPPLDRGDKLDHLVRRHATVDRFRDVVVVSDPATATLLLRVLAPGQLATPSGVSPVGLPRLGRQLNAKRAIIAGIVLGIVAGFVEPVLLLPAVVLLAGLALLALPATRHLGREAVLIAGIGALLLLVTIAGSTRFPANF